MPVFEKVGHCCKQFYHFLSYIWGFQISKDFHNYAIMQLYLQSRQKESEEKEMMHWKLT